MTLSSFKYQAVNSDTRLILSLNHSESAMRVHGVKHLAKMLDTEVIFIICYWPAVEVNQHETRYINQMWIGPILKYKILNQVFCFIILLDINYSPVAALCFMGFNFTLYNLGWVWHKICCWHFCWATWCFTLLVYLFEEWEFCRCYVCLGVSLLTSTGWLGICESRGALHQQKISTQISHCSAAHQDYRNKNVSVWCTISHKYLVSSMITKYWCHGLGQTLCVFWVGGRQSGTL